jgi:superfamily II DNA/RNA helicase
VSDFNSLPLPTALLRAVEVLGFTELTPVQRQALSLLARLDVRAARMQAPLLCPTRELAEQVSTETCRLHTDHVVRLRLSARGRARV